VLLQPPEPGNDPVVKRQQFIFVEVVDFDGHDGSEALTPCPSIRAVFTFGSGPANPGHSNGEDAYNLHFRIVGRAQEASHRFRHGSSAGEHGDAPVEFARRPAYREVSQAL